MAERGDKIPHLNYGAIGNGRVLALVSPEASIDWLCLPRFDSPSIFARLLDQDKGGSFKIESAGEAKSSRTDYIQNTNVLRTRIECADGSFDVIDFCPRVNRGLTMEVPLELHRLVVPREGSPPLRVHFDPRPDYARSPFEVIPGQGVIELRNGSARFYLHTNAPVTYVRNRQPFQLSEPTYFVLAYGAPSSINSSAAVQQLLDLTIATWRTWVKTCALPSFAAETVLRSALCLKLHIFEDTGAIIAAATTSIPEALGTERTWDYRYCWLRDAAFVVEALRRLSHLAEGEAFVRFLLEVAQEGPLQPVYGIGGEKVLPEERLDHLHGFAGCKPVRIGNAAYLQKQHDLMGEIILCLETLMTDERIVHEKTDRLMRLVERLVEESIKLAPLKDTGPWEFRTLEQDHTFSKVMCWVAAHRGAELAARFGNPATVERWSSWAKAFGEEILRRGYNPRLGFFTQILDGENPDASNLLLPTLGIIDPRDPRFQSTVEAYERLLVRNGWMLRYKNRDDFGETTSAFSICSFWWAEALALAGHLDRAVELFQRLVTYANPLGLFSEDVDPTTGKLLGNFPQAYTHVGLIHAAITIGELLEARDAKFRAWT
ncbi:MAG TPA: glycoside hydrolase family 15 protein [Bdellovibrionota bacterium]|nr:glycoside hydrolase family 15 protein [Bdellovibrionota bacterium]